MADYDRSVDTDLTNPITYRPMTGSSSGGPINILKGINHVCIGTDGGGSVLAPALATNLCSVLLKGVGLTAGEGKSTDGLNFAAGVGVMGRNLTETLAAAQTLCDVPLSNAAEKPVRVVIPAKGCMTLPDGNDANTLRGYLQNLPQNVLVTEHFFSDVYDRTALSTQLNQLLAQDSERLYLSLEGPIDLYAADESIPRSFAGEGTQYAAGVPSKAFVKVANICNCSAFTVPCNRLATGFVLVCPQGEAALKQGAALAAWLETVAPVPEMFSRYFIRHEKYCAPFSGADQ